MKKIEQFQITSLMLSGFKSYEEPTELVFGNPTVITGGNEASIRLHEAFGFRHSGTLHAVGRKFGRYLDVENYELSVGD